MIPIIAVDLPCQKSRRATTDLHGKLAQTFLFWSVPVSLKRHGRRPNDFALQPESAFE
ncbi:MAG TPA: hypothetical protein VMX16_01570 [Terriglobia bacterium]|nr:hypothetical protein [Terriglobia bacterium]